MYLCSTYTYMCAFVFKAIEVLSSIQPLKISLRLKRKSKPAMKAETATAMATRKKSRGRIYVCDSSEDEEVDGVDIKKGIDMEIEEPECMYDTSDFEVTLRNGQEDHDCVDGHPSGVFDGFRIPVIKKEGYYKLYLLHIYMYVCSIYVCKIHEYVVSSKIHALIFCR